MSQFTSMLPLLRALDAASLADAARSIAPFALRRLSPHLQPRHSLGKGFRLIGEAQTVRCAVNDFQAVVDALRQSPSPGTVLVIEGSPTHACAGELFTAECRRQGLAGLVVDGCIRDVEGIRALHFPVYASGTTPVAGTNAKPGSAGLVAEIGPERVSVAPGDLVFGDDDGVIALAMGDLKAAGLRDLIAAAQAIQDKEARVLKGILEGKPLLDLF